MLKARLSDEVNQLFGGYASKFRGGALEEIKRRRRKGRASPHCAAAELLTSQRAATFPAKPNANAARLHRDACVVPERGSQLNFVLPQLRFVTQSRANASGQNSSERSQLPSMKETS